MQLIKILVRTEQLFATVMRTLIFVFASVTVGIVQAAEVKSYDDIIKREVNGCDYPEDCTQCTEDIENVSSVFIIIS